VNVLFIRHAEKSNDSGDTGISARGLAQAIASAEYVRKQRVLSVNSSPLHRALATAEVIAGATGHSVNLDDRLIERMVWEGRSDSESHQRFRSDWERTVADRDFDPQSGDSSRSAGGRLESFLEELLNQQIRPGTHLAVSHGGVIIDLLRNLIGDDRLLSWRPEALTQELPHCSLTRVKWVREDWQLMEIGAVSHLPYELR
jgi:broad specificity phosphatase PhoE